MGRSIQLKYRISYRHLSYSGRSRLSILHLEARCPSYPVQHTRCERESHDEGASDG